jgi:5'-3' exonuclease
MRAFTTLILDGNWNLKRNFMKISEMDSNGKNCGGVYGFLRSTHSVLRKTMPDRVIIMWDGFLSGKLRYDEYPLYKANRKKMWELQKKIISQDFSNINEREEFDFLCQRDYLLDINDGLYLRQLEVDYLEADDLIAGYVLESEREERDEHIIIFSRDRDYKQLISERVSIITPDEQFPITVKNFKKKNGYILENELLFKCFEGDRSDNIQGVNGINKNTLIRLFPDIVDRKYTFNDLCDICEKRINGGDKTKTIKKILESREVLYRNARLMNLKKPFLTPLAERMLREIAHGDHVPDERYNFSGLIKKLTDDGYVTLLMRDGYDIHGFFSPFYRMRAKEKEFSKKKNEKKI